jgi:hypothetical protein
MAHHVPGDITVPVTFYTRERVRAGSPRLGRDGGFVPMRLNVPTRCGMHCRAWPPSRRAIPASLITAIRRLPQRGQRHDPHTLEDIGAL